MTYVLDTNVLSEVMKAEPDAAVMGWLRSCPAEAMFTTAISRGEIVYGIRRLPDGIRRRRWLRNVRPDDHRSKRVINGWPPH